MSKMRHPNDTPSVVAPQWREPEPCACPFGLAGGVIRDLIRLLSVLASLFFITGHP